MSETINIRIGLGVDPGTLQGEGMGLACYIFLKDRRAHATASRRMVQRIIAAAASLTLIAGNFMACSAGQLAGVAPKKGSDRPKAGALNDGEGEKDEARIADQPQEVTGAFLTASLICALVDTNRTKFPREETKETVGCALVRDGLKVNITDYVSTLEFKDASTQRTIESPSEEAPLFAKWHRYGQIPKSVLAATEALFTVFLKDGRTKVAAYRFSLAKAESFKVEAGKKEPAPEVLGVTFKPIKIWNASEGFGERYMGLHSGHYCDGGIVKNQVAIPNTAIPIGELANLAFDEKISDVPPTPGKNVLEGRIFVPWWEYDVSLTNRVRKSCVLKGAGCLFVVSPSLSTGGKEVYIFDAAAQLQPGFSEEELRRQVSASLCVEP